MNQSTNETLSWNLQGTHTLGQELASACDVMRTLSFQYNLSKSVHGNLGQGRDKESLHSIFYCSLTHHCSEKACEKSHLLMAKQWVCQKVGVSDIWSISDLCAMVCTSTLFSIYKKGLVANVLGNIWVRPFDAQPDEGKLSDGHPHSALAQIPE